MMSQHIFRHEFKSRIKSLVTWSLSTAVLILIFFSFYPTFAGQGAMMAQLLSNFPEELQAAFGLGGIPLDTIMGFYSFIFLFVQLCLAIQAGNMGFGLVSIEESELTADFLLSKPVSRGQILHGKLFAAGMVLLITDLVVWTSSFIAIPLFRSGNSYEPRTLVILLLSLIPFQLFFLSIGLLISLIVKRVRSVTPYSLGLGFGMYILNAFGGVFGDVKLELITPFKHFDPGFIIQNNTWDTPLVLTNIALSLVSILISYLLYIRRDIPAVS